MVFEKFSIFNYTIQYGLNSTICQTNSHILGKNHQKNDH